MKTPTNNLDVCIFEPLLSSTVYPVLVHDDDGNSDVAFQSIDDSQISSLMCDDFSLQALLRAGVDPSTMRVNTSNYSRQNEVLNAIEGLSTIDFPSNENSVEIEN